MKASRKWKLAILYWAEKHGHDLADARRRARSRKKLFDAADEIVHQGWEPDQVTLFLQGHLEAKDEITHEQAEEISRRIEQPVGEIFRSVLNRRQLDKLRQRSVDETVSTMPACSVYVEPEEVT